MTDRVDFDALAAAYGSGLQATLRGFRPAGAPAWLALWVGDDDLVRSLLGIAEAAQAAGLDAVDVALGAATFGALDVARLEAAVGAAALRVTRRPDGGADLGLRLGALAAPALAPARTPREAPRAASPAAPAAVATPAPASAGLCPRRVAAVAGAASHEAPAPPGALRAEEGGAGCAALVDAGHLVTRATHQGARDPVERAVLEALCATLEGRPLQEGADHGALRVYEALRDPAARRPAAGIVHPERLVPAVGLARRLARALLAAHRAATGYASTTNEWKLAPGPRWAGLDAARQVDAVLDEARAEGLAGVRCLSVDARGAVALEVEDRALLREQPGALLRLERRLKANLDPALYVHLEALRDQNKLRRRVGGEEPT